MTGDVLSFISDLFYGPFFSMASSNTGLPLEVTAFANVPSAM